MMQFKLVIYNLYLALILTAIFTFISGVFGIITIEMKRKLGPYARNGVPLCLAMTWGFVLFPFCALLPASIIISGNNNSTQ